ncbi:MAG: hypothetical protein U0903_02300 [Planctomycetales bacterium]
MWWQENPWPVACVGFGLALVFAIVWTRSMRRGWLLAVAGALLIACGAFALDEMTVTGREKMEQEVRELCFAFQRNELVQAQSYISDQAPEWKGRMKEAMDLVQVDTDLTVRDINAEFIGEGTAKTKFRANATVKIRRGESLGRQPSMWELTWQKEKEVWKIIKVVRLDPINGKRELGLLE